MTSFPWILSRRKINGLLNIKWENVSVTAFMVDMDSFSFPFSLVSNQKISFPCDNISTGLLQNKARHVKHGGPFPLGKGSSDPAANLWTDVNQLLIEKLFEN